MQAPQQSQGGQRIAAQVEETVQRAHAIEPEHIGECAADGHLRGRRVARGKAAASSGRVAAGTGSAARSSLPFTVTGSDGRNTKAAGTMNSGSTWLSALAERGNRKVDA